MGMIDWWYPSALDCVMSSRERQRASASIERAGALERGAGEPLAVEAPGEPGTGLGDDGNVREGCTAEDSHPDPVVRPVVEIRAEGDAA